MGSVAVAVAVAVAIAVAVVFAVAVAVAVAAVDALEALQLTVTANHALPLQKPGAVAFATMLADEIRNHAHLRDGVRHMHRCQQAATMLGQIVNSLGRRILLLPISSIGKLTWGGL